MAKYVIFDCDGVLVDSERPSRRSSIAVLKRYGIKVAVKELVPYTGMALREIFAALAKRFKVDLPVAKAVDERMKLYIKTVKGTMHLLPGAFELLSDLKAKKIKIALASSGRMDKIKANLSDIHINRIFDAVVSEADVKKSKPDPHIFLVAAKKLGARPKDCAVVEDSVDGVLAAKNAGMKCVAVQTSFPRPKLKKADIIVKSIADISADMLIRL